MARPIDPDRLKRAADLAGFNQAQLADAAGISKQYLCDIQAGRRTLKRNPRLVQTIAKALDVPVDWILRPAAEEAA